MGSAMSLVMLKRLLTNWSDFDAAQRAIAICFGLMTADTPALNVKWVFWTDNPISRMLTQTLNALVESGVLETNEDEQFRSQFPFSADNPGLWMFHCHVLLHGSYRMSMTINYAGVSTSYEMGSESGNIPDSGSLCLQLKTHAAREQAPFSSQPSTTAAANPSMPLMMSPTYILST
jgi:multicopper oxidase